MTVNNTHDDWWKQAVVYQIYPRSFKDVNGDGLGDIAGITETIDYLKHLGVDAIWLSPFYPSDLADGGYDVIDYRDVDPRLGTMDDFDRLAAAAHEAGLKIIVDIVPNHTSNKHAFFRAALAAEPGSPERDRYIFREGRGEHGELPPNDWQAMFGGPAWTRADDGQWYLHLFTEEQPDLNWHNRDVHEEFLTTLRFWSDHGADGFRVDVAHGLAKDLESTPLEDMPADLVQHQLCHDFTNPLFDRREVHDIYREWRRVFNEYDPPRFAVAEAWVVPEHQHLYAAPDELGQSFNFDFAKANWDADEFREAIDAGLEAAAETDGSTTTWVMNNHDVPRSPSRYGLPQVKGPYHQLAHDWLLRDGRTYTEDRELGTRRARAAALMELGLPGSAYIDQGEELGLFEVADIPWDQLEDPTAFNTRRAATDKGRDGCRVPLPWTSDGPSFGFSPVAHADGTPSAAPHLPQPRWFADLSVARELSEPDSMLALYRAALSFRQEALTATGDASATLLDDGVRDDGDGVVRDDGVRDGSHDCGDSCDCGAVDGGPRATVARTVDSACAASTTVAYTRTTIDGSRFISVTNFGPEPIALPDGDVALASIPLDNGMLPSDATAWIVSPTPAQA